MKSKIKHSLSLLFITSALFLLSIACNAQTYSDSLKTSLSSAHDTAKIRILNQAAAHFQVSNPDTSIILANQSLKLCLTKHDTLNELEATVLLARAYQNHSEFYKSTQFFYKALAKSEKWHLQKKQASYHNSIAISFYYLQDFEKAIYHLEKAASLKLQSNEIAEYGTIVGNLAGVLHQLGRNQEAIKALGIAVSKLQGKENKGILGNLYNTFGSVYQMGYNKLDSAEYFYRKAYNLVKDEPEGIFQLTAHTNIGMVCSLQNKISEAEYHLKEALRISLKFKRDIATISIYETLSNLYAKKQDYKQAFSFRTLQLQLKDSIFKTDKEKIVADLEEQYQNEKGKQIIQTQKLELAKSRNKTLIGVIMLIVLIFTVLALFVYYRFKNKVQKQVEAAKEVFFSNVVHEIRTPLSMIKAPISLLQKRDLGEEDQAQLRMAEKNLNRLNELINQMLLVSKIDAQKLMINESFGNFNEFIESILITYQIDANNKQQHFSINNQINTPFFQFDADAIQKIVSNLLSNAIKYTPINGKIGIDLTLNNETLTIIVWDNGIGIRDEDKDKIFNRFYRTNEVTKTNENGVGIGLSLVKSLVEALHGSIELQSNIDEGSLFTLQIPIKTATFKFENTNAINNKTIMVVEDDEDITSFNKALLEKNGYRVISVSNGIAALETLKSVLPDLIISDLMMPGMDGVTFLKAIRKDINTEHIPFLVLSAKSAADNRIELLKLGAQGYLPKPFLPDELLNLVSSQLLLVKQKVEHFNEEIKVTEKNAEEKYIGTDPYTEKFFKIVFQNIDNSEFSVEQLADLMATNRSHFQRKIKTLTGYSPSELIKMVRLDKSKELLLSKQGNITEVAFMCGFSSQSYFTKSFTQHFGVSPSQFIAQVKQN